MYRLCSNAFAIALETVPDEDWGRNWPANRTIMVRKTSNRIKKIIDKMRLPTDVHWSWKFWNDSQNGTTEKKLDFMMRQLKQMTSFYKITTLVLKCCNIQINLQQLIEVLELCPSLQKLNLKRNNISAEGVSRIAKALRQCHNIELTYLDLSINKIGDVGAARVAELFRQCPKLSHLDLSLNKISDTGGESLASVIRQCNKLALINFYLTHNLIQADGIESIVKVLTQCPNIKNLDLSWNVIGFVEAECIARSYNVDLSSLYQIRTHSYP
jgi:Leucine-rich repeat (LRR) protein